MKRRSFLGLMAASPFARAAVLNDYSTGGLYDLSAALRDGPVELLAQEYEIMPCRVAYGDWAGCLKGRARLLYDGTGPAFQPLDQDRPTDRVTLTGFDLICEAKSGSAQHGIYAPAARHWQVRDVSISDFGGCGFYAYGKRTSDGGLDPCDSTKHRLEEVRVLRCGTGIRLHGSPASVRGRGGTSNMCRLDHCTVSEADGNGYEIIQGAANLLTGCIAGLCGRSGFCVNWYNNTIVAPVFEQNGQYGIAFGSADECRGNDVIGWHDGGGHISAFINVGRNVVSP